MAIREGTKRVGLYFPKWLANAIELEANRMGIKTSEYVALCLSYAVSNPLKDRIKHFDDLTKKGE